MGTEYSTNLFEHYLAISYPIDNGTVSNWDAMEKNGVTLFYNELQ